MRAPRVTARILGVVERNSFRFFPADRFDLIDLLAQTEPRERKKRNEFRSTKDALAGSTRAGEGRLRFRPSYLPDNKHLSEDTRRIAMTTSWMRKPATLGLSLGVTLMASVFGCGGQGTESDAVVVPDSTVSSNPAAKTSAASAPGSSAPSAATSARRRPRRSRPKASAPSRARSPSPVIRRLPRSSLKKARRPRTPMSAPRTRL